jgi:hypothetical protein
MGHRVSSYFSTSVTRISSLSLFSKVLRQKLPTRDSCRGHAIVKNMLLHSRQGSGEHRPVDINALVEESLNPAYHGLRITLGQR